MEASGGLFKCRLVPEFRDSLPLSCGDPEHQGVVKSVYQIDGSVEVFMAGDKSGQNLEFVKIAGLDVFDGLASG